MRAFFYWYIRTLEKTFIPIIVLVGGFRAALFFEVFIISKQAEASLTHFFDVYGFWVVGGLTIFNTLNIAVFNNANYLATAQQNPLSKFYDGMKGVGIFYLAVPLIIWFLPVALESNAAALRDVSNGIPPLVSLAGAGYLLSLFIGGALTPLVRIFVKPGWQAEHLDELKEETTKVLRLHGAFMENEAEKAMHGMKYPEVLALKAQCDEIGALTEMQTEAYNDLQSTMEARGVKVAHGAAFSDKNSAQLMAEQEGTSGGT